MANHRQRLGEQIAAARKERGWRLADVAKRTGRDVGRISEMEAGKSNSTVDSLSDAGRILGMELVFVPASKLEEALAMSGKRPIRREAPYAVPSVLQEMYIDDAEPDVEEPPHVRP